MVKWFVEKDNKIPLYLQLKDLIMYYISTGVIKDRQQLPFVNELASHLGINFGTVRKAYKELESEGMVTMKRGSGTFVSLGPNGPPEIPMQTRGDFDRKEMVRGLVLKLLRQEVHPEEIRSLVDQTVNEVSREISRQYVIFTECNPLQVKEISLMLEDVSNIKIKIKPVLLDDLEQTLKSVDDDLDKLRAIVTTGFHFKEVQDILAGRKVEVLLLVTNMSPETRLQLSNFGNETKYGFICRDRKSIPFYTDLLHAELGENISLATSILDDGDRVDSIVKAVDVLLVTPPVYSDVTRIAPHEKPVFNVFDRVDPMSLRMVKESIFRKSVS